MPYELWIYLLIPSALVGFACAHYARGCLGLLLSGALPLSGVVIFLLYDLIFLPNDDYGGSLWPFALAFWGTGAIIAGPVGYLVGVTILLDRR